MIALTFQYALPIAVCFYLLALVFYLARRPKNSSVALWLGFLFHTFFLLSRGLFLGAWLPNAIFDGPYFLPWLMALISLTLGWFSGEENYKPVIYSLIIPIALFSLLALIFPKGIMVPDPKHESIFVTLYYGVDTIAQACFILGAWFAAFHLRGKDKDRIFNSFIIWGFFFYSASQVIGAYWAYLGWASPIQWSSKHLQSASIWCYFAAVLHLRYFPTLNSRHEAWFSLGGVALLLVFMYGTQITIMNFPRIGG